MLCTVDLTRHRDLSLQLVKAGSDPYCEMSVNSKVEEKINVAAGVKASLSFLDCPGEDVRLTADQIIGKKSNIQRSHLILFKSTAAFATKSIRRLVTLCLDSILKQMSGF